MGFSSISTGVIKQKKKAKDFSVLSIFVSGHAGPLSVIFGGVCVFSVWEGGTVMKRVHDRTEVLINVLKNS